MIGFLLFLIFLLLAFSLSLAQVKKGRFAKSSRMFRWIVVFMGIGFFVYYFFENSATRYQNNLLSMQIINKLPVTLDFYLIKIEKDSSSPIYITEHIGKISPKHLQIKYLNMTQLHEFWVIGYLGKKNLVYFSQHLVPNKNLNQTVEVNNYVVQSFKLSAVAKAYIEQEQEKNVILSIWISMDFLLLFLNLVSLFIRRK